MCSGLCGKDLGLMTVTEEKKVGGARTELGVGVEQAEGRGAS